MEKSGGSERFYFLGLQNHYRWWLQPWNWKMLTPWKESYDEPRQHIKKQGHYFAEKGQCSQGYGFSSSHVRMWELDHKESRALKNWCVWTVVLDKGLLRVPWVARRSNQSILKEVNPEYLLEELMLKLKFQSFGHLMRRANSLEKTLILGKIEGKKRRGWQRMLWLDSITDSVAWFWAHSRRLWRTEEPGVLQAMGS